MKFSHTVVLCVSLFLQRKSFLGNVGGFQLCSLYCAKTEIVSEKAFELEIICVLNSTSKTKHCIVDLNRLKEPINHPGFVVFFCFENSSSQCSNQNQIKCFYILNTKQKKKKRFLKC